MNITTQNYLRTGLLILFLCALSSCSKTNSVYRVNTLDVNEGVVWHYFKGTVDPPRLWNSREFDDSSWLVSASGVGYGIGNHKTILSDMKGKYSAVYARQEFSVDNYSQITQMVLSLVCDGPFIAYLNNIEASRSKRRQKGDPLNLIGFAHELDPGKNVISVKCSNDNIDSDDYSFIPSFEFDEE